MEENTERETESLYKYSTVRRGRRRVKEGSELVLFKIVICDNETLPNKLRGGS